jgi:hypothetical protein
LDKFTSAALSLILAAVLWILVFLVRPFNFWAMMSLATLTLLIISLAINRPRIPFDLSASRIVLGLITALLLYGLFFAGFQVTKIIPVFSEGVSEVYELRASAPPSLIALLLVIPIAPGEEVYWRGLIQRRFAEEWGSTAGFISATAAYALVHLPTMNPPLVLTAFIGGLVWGYLYKFTGSLIPGAFSHVIFDLLIFVIAPLV